jgi:Zn-dependent oligopeptidase
MNDSFALEESIEQIQRRTQQICAHLQQASQAIRNMDLQTIHLSPITSFQTSFVRWHQAEGKAAEWACRCVLGSMVHGDPEKRSAFTEAKLQLRQQWDTIYTDRQVFQVMNAVSAIIMGTGKSATSGSETNTTAIVESFSAVDRRMMEKTLQLFRRNGAALLADSAVRLREIKKEISRLELEFQRNLNEDDTIVECTCD